jgi:hypothetical protein
VSSQVSHSDGQKDSQPQEAGDGETSLNLSTTYQDAQGIFKAGVSDL